jgi:tetratricopeptide (TPR) repeat protein
MPPTVFISYSHKDEAWKDRLVTHLGVLEHQGLLQIWNDRNIGAGDEWFEEIRKGMDTAKVAVLLISAHSLTSKFILHTEIPRLLERRESEGMTVFPVILKSCAWQKLPWLKRFQARPKDGRPLAGFKGNDRDRELTKITEEILALVGQESQVVAGTLSASVIPQFPSLILPLHQLPTPPADFTGRQEDLNFLRSKLSQGGTGAIFGLRGMGGIGKTTVALKLADELKPRFPDAQIYLDLKGVDPQPLTAAQAMAHVIRAFHPEARLPEGESDLVGLYRSVINGRRVLLLMDNAARKEQVEPLTPPSTCLLLVTSRFRFALPGLIDRDLDEMPEKDARDLLLRIAPRIGDAADEIARLCGRLPLALRLAGSALAERPDLSPFEYARRFREGKEKLELVEASLKTSYDLLTEKRRRFWRLLAVFPATFDTKAAAAIWELEMDDATGHMGELVRSSLVEWEEAEERYRLHDLALVFAHKQITAAEQERGQRRHAEHFLEVLRSANSFYKNGGEETRLGLGLFDREWNNIRVGQAWASTRFNNDKEAADICSSYPDRGNHCLNLRLHPRERIPWLEVGLAASRHLESRSAESAHLGNLGIAYADLGETRRAIEFYEQHLTIAHEIGDRLGEGAALGNLGNVYADLGETRRAIELYEQHLTIAREIGDRLGESHALGNLGSAYKDLGEARRAIELYEQDLTIAREIGDQLGEGHALGNLGSAYADLGKTQRTIELYEQWLTVAREIGDRRGEGHALGCLGIAYANLGETRRAIELFEQWLTIAREVGDRRGEARASLNLGLALEKEGDLARAGDLMQVCVDYEREIGHPDAEKHTARVEVLRASIAEQKS